eukprot:408030-Hanusia_phi.AAC.1
MDTEGGRRKAVDAEILRSRFEVEARDKELQGMVQTVREKEEVIERLNGELRARSLSMSEYGMRYSEVEKELALTRAENAEQRRLIELLKNEQAVATSHREEGRGERVRELELALHKAHDQLSKCSGELRNVSEELRGLKSEHARAMGELTHSKESYKQACEEQDRMQQRHVEECKMRRLAEERAVYAESRLEETTTHVLGLQHSIAELKREVVDLTQEREGLTRIVMEGGSSLPHRSPIAGAEEIGRSPYGTPSRQAFPRLASSGSFMPLATPNRTPSRTPGASSRACPTPLSLTAAAALLTARSASSTTGDGTARTSNGLLVRPSTKPGSTLLGLSVVISSSPHPR